MADRGVFGAVRTSVPSPAIRYSIKRYRPGSYSYIDPWPFTALFGTGTPNANDALWLIPFSSDGGPIDRIGTEVTTAGSTGAMLRLGAYDDKPGTRLYGGIRRRLLDAGLVDAATTGIKEIALPSPVVLPPSSFLALRSEGSPVTLPIVRTMPVIGGLHVQGSLGATALGFAHNVTALYASSTAMDSEVVATTGIATPPLGVFVRWA